MEGVRGGRLKVLHLVKTSFGAIWALRQMRELVKLNVEVHVAIPSDGHLIKDYERAGITIHPFASDFPITSPWNLPRRLSDFRSLVDEIQPAIIHSHFVGSTLLMRLALGKRHPVPRIFQVPGPLHLEHPFFRNGEIMTAGEQDYWIGSCRWTCERYRNSGVGEDRVFLAYYGTETEKFSPAMPEGNLRDELGVGSEVPLVGMIAYMYPPKWYLRQKRGLKGHEDLIDAIAICLNKGIDLRAVFVGGAWNNANWYEERVRAYGARTCRNRVVFMGTRHDIVELYRELDVAVHPSHSENVGGAVESLLMRVPTIASNVGGLPDLVKDGETGWLVPPGEPEVLADKLIAVLNNPLAAKECAERGQKLAKEMFDIRITSGQILDIYKRILHG